jgi:predicted amidophosphoribosyltransferase
LPRFLLDAAPFVDIMTTGSTLEECARMMLQAGAAAVHVLVLARA